MARLAVTYEQVAAVANALFAQGVKNPGTKTVREELGKRAGPSGSTGSPNTIQRHLDAWRAKDRPMDPAEPAPQLPPSLAADISRALTAAASVAREKVEERLAGRRQLSWPRDDNYPGRRVASRRNVTRPVVPASGNFFNQEGGEPWGGQLRYSEVVHAFKAGRETSLPLNPISVESAHGSISQRRGSQAVRTRQTGAVTVYPFQTSAGTAAGLRRLPRTISVTRALRHALTRRCSVLNWALPA